MTATLQVSSSTVVRAARAASAMGEYRRLRSDILLRLPSAAAQLVVMEELKETLYLLIR